MMATGKIKNIQTRPVGTFLEGPESPGAETLKVSSVSGFNPSGGFFLWDGEDVPVAYSAIREEPSGDLTEAGYPGPPNQVMYLSEPLGEARDEGSRILLWPLVNLMEADVYSPVSQEPSIPCLVPAEISVQLQDGIRGSGFEESVEIELMSDRRFWVTRLLNTVPGVLAKHITGPGTPITDEVPPSHSPGATVVPGIGTLFVKWDPVENSDLVTYDVHVSPLTGFTPDASTLAGSTAGTQFTVRQLPGGSPLLPDVEYAVRVWASDDDGHSLTPGAEGTGKVTLVTGLDIAANAVAANHLAANSVTADKLEAVVALLSEILVGDKISISPEGGIQVVSPTGVTKLAPDGSGNVFAGEATLDAATIKGKLSLYGLDNFLSGRLRLNTGVVKPSQAPSLSYTHDRAPFQTGTGYNRRGLEESSSGTMWITTDTVVGSGGNLQSWMKNGSVVGGYAANIPSGWQPLGGVARIGSQIYVLCQKISSPSLWKVFVYSSATLDGSGNFTPVPASDSGEMDLGATALPMLGRYHTSSSQILIAFPNSYGLTIRRVNVSGWSTDYDFTWTGWPSGTPVQSVAWSPDLGVWIASAESYHNTLKALNSSRPWELSLASGYSWPVARAVHGLFVSSTLHAGTTVPKMTMVNNAFGFYDYSYADETCDFAYSWYDGNSAGAGVAETEIGPLRTYSIPKYSKVVIYTDSPPNDGTTDGADRVRIYSKHYLSSNFRLLDTWGVGETSRIYARPYVTDTAGPKTTNEFESRIGAIGRVSSIRTSSDRAGVTTTPTWDLKGDGSGRMGPLEWDATGKSDPPAIRLYKTSAQNATSNAPVNFNVLIKAAGGMTHDTPTGMAKVPRDGWYHVSGSVTWANYADTSIARYLGVCIAKSSVSSPYWTSLDIQSGHFSPHSLSSTQPQSTPVVSHTVYALKGDLIGLWCASGASWPLTVVANWQTYMSAHWVGY